MEYLNYFAIEEFTALSVVTEIGRERQMLLEKANAYLRGLDGRTRKVFEICSFINATEFFAIRVRGSKGRNLFNN